MAANDMRATVMVSSANRSPRTPHRGSGSASCISSTPDESSADQRDTARDREDRDQRLREAQPDQGEQHGMHVAGKAAQIETEARGRCEEGRSDIHQEHDRRRGDSHTRCPAERPDPPDPQSANDGNAQQRIGRCIVDVRRTPGTRANQPGADVATREPQRRDDGGDGGRHEEEHRGRQIEDPTRSDRVRLVEEKEHRDVGEGRPIDARPPDAVEKKHEHEQGAPRRRGRAEIGDELRDQQPDPEAGECQPPQRSAFAHQAANLGRRSRDQASQPAGGARQRARSPRSAPRRRGSGWRAGEVARYPTTARTPRDRDPRRAAPHRMRSADPRQRRRSQRNRSRATADSRRRCPVAPAPAAAS